MITDEQEDEKDNLLETVDKESLKEYLNLIVNQHARSLYEQSVYYIILICLISMRGENGPCLMFYRSFLIVKNGT